MPSLCKHHLDTADAKRPKHHLDTSRKPPKPQAKKLFHVTFGIPINNLWSHRAHAQPMQTPSGHCRCKKTQTPSRHEPKTAQTASQKTVSRYLWNPHKQSLEPQSRLKLNINDRRRLMPQSCERKKKFGLKTPRRAPPLGGVGGYPPSTFTFFICECYAAINDCRVFFTPIWNITSKSFCGRLPAVGLLGISISFVRTWLIFGLNQAFSQLNLLHQYP